MNALVIKMFRFGCVGMVGMLVDFSITYFTKEKLRWNKYLANATGFTVAVLGNYLLNRYWTFNVHNEFIISQLMLFILVSLAGLCINTFIIYLFHQIVEFPFYASKFAAICIVFIWNFFANALITFK